MDTNTKETWLTLPKKTRPEKEIWEQFGFQFLEIKGREDSWKVKLPEGWKLKTIYKFVEDRIIDEQGRNRGQVFYEHMFNDLQNYMALLPRYSIGTKNISDEMKVIYFGNENEILFVAGQINRTKMKTREDYIKVPEAELALLKLALAWANTNYPNWKKENAYWDTPVKEDTKTKTKKLHN